MHCLDREEHYQDLRNYQRGIAENEEKYELIRPNYEKVIAENMKSMKLIGSTTRK